MPLPPIDNKPPIRGGLQPRPPKSARPTPTRKPLGYPPARAGKIVDIVEPPAKPLAASRLLLPPISLKPLKQKKGVYKGAFDVPGAVPEPDDPSKYAREFEEDVEDYLVKFERACSNMSLALTEYSKTIEFIKDNYDMKLHPNEYKQMCEYMVDFCPAALEIMSSIADYGRGLASRYSKKYPDYWKNPKYEKLLIRGYTAQSEIVDTLRPSRPLSIHISNFSSSSVSNLHNALEVELTFMEGVKSMTPATGGNFYLATTESNIKNIMSGIIDKSMLIVDELQTYTAELKNYSSPLTIPEVKYTREEARIDLDKENTKVPNQSIVEELEAIQRALKEVEWYNYRLKPHKRGKQYKILTDNSYDHPSKATTKHLDEWAYATCNGDKKEFSDGMLDSTNDVVNCDLKIPLVAIDHFETELKKGFDLYMRKMLDSCKGRYMIVGELRNFRMVKGDGKTSNDPKNINYNTDHKVITPKTFRGITLKTTTNYPCRWGIVAEIYVYPQYKYYIDVIKHFQCSASHHHRVIDDMVIDFLYLMSQFVSREGVM